MVMIWIICYIEMGQNLTFSLLYAQNAIWYIWFNATWLYFVMCLSVSIRHWNNHPSCPSFPSPSCTLILSLRALIHMSLETIGGMLACWGGSRCPSANILRTSLSSSLNANTKALSLSSRWAWKFVNVQKNQLVGFKF